MLGIFIQWLEKTDSFFFTQFSIVNGALFWPEIKLKKNIENKRDKGPNTRHYTLRGDTKLYKVKTTKEPLPDNSL